MACHPLLFPLDGSSTYCIAQDQKLAELFSKRCSQEACGDLKKQEERLYLEVVRLLRQSNFQIQARLLLCQNQSLASKVYSNKDLDLNVSMFAAGCSLEKSALIEEIKRGLKGSPEHQILALLELARSQHWTQAYQQIEDLAQQDTTAGHLAFLMLSMHRAKINE